MAGRRQAVTLQYNSYLGIVSMAAINVKRWLPFRLRRVGLAMLVVVALLTGCGALNLFSINDDVNFGKQMDAEIRSNPKEYPILNNEAIRAYLQAVVNRIIQAPQVKYRGTFSYTVTVINDDRTINAFATPGGYVYVYTGLLRFIDNEATLAGVLGHEIAHAEERHGTEHMTTQLGADIALQVALGKNPSRLAQVAGSAASLLGTMKNSRDDEMESDTRSFTYLKSVGYYPGSIKFFFEKMMSRGSRSIGVLDSWASTHPTSEDRVENMNRLLRENNVAPPTPTQLLIAPYRNAMRSLR